MVGYVTLKRMVVTTILIDQLISQVALISSGAVSKSCHCVGDRMITRQEPAQINKCDKDKDESVRRKKCDDRNTLLFTGSTLAGISVWFLLLLFINCFYS